VFHVFHHTTKLFLTCSPRPGQRSHQFTSYTYEWACELKAVFDKLFDLSAMLVLKRLLAVLQVVLRSIHQRALYPLNASINCPNRLEHAFHPAVVLFTKIHNVLESGCV